MYTELVKHYESCLKQHGSTPKGVDWPNQADLAKRHDVMLDLLLPDKKNDKIKLIDLGCGYGSFYEHILKTPHAMDIIYHGLDASQAMINAARLRHPSNLFQHIDILNEDTSHLEADYIIMNGLFTEKRTLSWAQMLDFLSLMIKKSFSIARKGIAFNVMQYQVDWSNPNLFHCAYDTLADVIIKNCSRHFQFRADYGLYEYTAYVYHHPNHY